MENLQEKIDELRIQTSVFADLCEFSEVGNDCLNQGYSGDQKLLSSVLCIAAQESRRIEKLTDAIFDDERMIEFYRSLEGDKKDGDNS